jgi:HTH-type transcriptional regulator / antitoxin HigA
MRQMIAEAFPPGDFIREEMEARGWSQLDLADILELQPPALNQILAGKRKVSPEIAIRLSGAFGTSADFWMNLQTTYDLWKSQDRDAAVARRARLYSIAPVREMVKRGWIESSGNIDVLEKRVCDFLAIKSVENEPKFNHAAHTSLNETTTAQMAWLFRARQLSLTLTVPAYRESAFEKLMAELRSLAHEPTEARHVSRVLSDFGIRFVVVEPLPNTRIDGACFWLSPKEPVVVLSVRYDRVDSFWHWLGHELGHVKNRDASLDIEVDSDLKRDEDEKANRFAASMLIDQLSLDSFIARVGPLYSHAKIAGFAATAGVHPGIVVGQLHHRGELEWSHGRSFLTSIRRFVVASALTDGWGAMLPSKL